ncbi:MAG TPA: sulfite exporter TauE/SafE family protein, partial [Desulfobacterales bacterium]|nr:sulfite exporter TauE/SafE family protein [Desulfobacterales bacterium]
MHVYVWVCLILFLAGFTHGVSGFGSVMLSIPLLAVVLDIKTVIPLANLVAVTMTVTVFVQLRHQFD